MATTPSSMEWNNDQHSINVLINKSNLEITKIYCPHNGEGKCKHNDTPCIVTWFLQQYGLECNVGVVVPAETIPIAWTLIGAAHDELSSTQIWVIPVADEAFSAWIATQS